MDKTLAEIYGTNQVEEADVEKLAAAELAEQLTETGDAQIDDETLEALAQEVLSQEDSEEASDEQAVSEPEMDEAQEKIAEADYLGRIMAHSFVQESREIQKQAEYLGDEVPNHPSEIGHGKPTLHGEAGGGQEWTKEHGVAGKGVSGPAAKPSVGARARGAKIGFMKNLKGGAGVSRAAKWGTRGAVGAAGLAGAGALAYGAKKAFGSKEKRSSDNTFTDSGHKGALDNFKDLQKMKETGEKAGTTTAAKAESTGAKKALEAVRGKAGKAWGAVKKHPRIAAGVAGGALVAGGGAYTAKKYHEKHSSAVDTLAEQRALEVLAENGYDVDAVLNAVQEYQAAPEQEKVSEVEGVNPYDVLADTVETRAEEMLNELVEAGIIAVPEEQE